MCFGGMEREVINQVKKANKAVGLLNNAVWSNKHMNREDDVYLQENKSNSIQRLLYCFLYRRVNKTRQDQEKVKW